jgi:copper(I)-binding protein
MKLRHKLVIASSAVALALACGMAAAPAVAQAAAPTPPNQAGPLQVASAWARATAPGQTTGGGYMEIRNNGAEPDRLVAIQSPLAERVEMHETVTQGDVSSMRPVQGGVAVPPHGDVKFSPGGYHIMFIKLKQPLAAGSQVPATLTFEKAGAVQVQFDVKPINYRPGGATSGMPGMPGMAH